MRSFDGLIVHLLTHAQRACSTLISILCYVLLLQVEPVGLVSLTAFKECSFDSLSASECVVEFKNLEGKTGLEGQPLYLVIALVGAGKASTAGQLLWFMYAVWEMKEGAAGEVEMKNTCCRFFRIYGTVCYRIHFFRIIPYSM